MIATIFHNPLTISSAASMWLLIPICAAVAVVYKTVRAEHFRDIFREILVLMVYMALGLGVLGAALWAVQEYWP